jgi:hypothetical protein
MISVSGFNNKVDQEKEFKGLIHGKMGQESAQITSIHDSTTIWRKDSKYLM